MSKDIYLLGIESSCDDTSAAVLKNDTILSNTIANQQIHTEYGGVVPELASRAHMQNIVPTVHHALKTANVQIEQLDGIAFTRGPGLMGSLLVGSSFAKSLALSLEIPLIEVNHMQAHVLAHFIKDSYTKSGPQFPFLCLTASGGHTQIVHVQSHLEMKVIGTTLDDAVGEAFDKCAKILRLAYPGGPLIDKYAKMGSPDKFTFPHPKIKGYDYSFSGIKTAVLYFVRDETAKNPDFIKENLADLCASIQRTLVGILMEKLTKAAEELGIDQIALAGGVAANSELRSTLEHTCQKHGWKPYIPAFSYCTDNAAMIGITGYYKFLEMHFASQAITPAPRLSLP